MRLSDFGPSLSGIKTAQILQELKDPKVTTKLASTFHDFCIGLRELWKIEDRMVFENLWECWKELFRNRISSQPSIPEKLRTHFLTTLTGMARDMRRLNHIRKGWAPRKKSETLRKQIDKYHDEFLKNLPKE